MFGRGFVRRLLVVATSLGLLLTLPEWCQLRLGVHLCDSCIDTTPERNLQSVPDCIRVHWGICLMNNDGSNQHQIEGTESGDTAPNISRDGTKIVFQRSDEIYSVNVDGSNLRQLTSNGGSNPNDAPVWSPDGTQIAYSEISPTGGPGEHDC